MEEILRRGVTLAAPLVFKKIVQASLKRFGFQLVRIGSAEAQRSPEDILRPIDEPFRGALLSMYRGEPQVGLDGQLHEVNRFNGISPQEGIWLYQLCRDSKPKATLEIGMCYGFSTLFFLAALAKNGSGLHTSIDPNETSHWHGIALTKIKEIGLQGSLRLLEDTSSRAAVDLCREGCAFDLILIDGAHLYEYALADFTLFAPLCSIGGHIILDDTWMPSIRTAISFIRTNRRDFSEVRPVVPEFAVFRKIGEDRRDWDHFARFEVAG